MVTEPRRKPLELTSGIDRVPSGGSGAPVSRVLSLAFAAVFVVGILASVQPARAYSCPPPYLPCASSSMTLTPQHDGSPQQYRWIDSRDANRPLEAKYGFTSIAGTGTYVEGDGQGSGLTCGSSTYSNCLDLDEYNALQTPTASGCRGLPIGFNFVFHGTTYDCVWVNMDGFVTFANSEPTMVARHSYPAGKYHSPVAFPNTNVPGNTITAAWSAWDDSSYGGTGCQGGVFYETKSISPAGGTPYKIFVVEWNNVLLWDKARLNGNAPTNYDNAPFCPGTGSCDKLSSTFQIILRETSNNITILHNTVKTNPAEADAANGNCSNTSTDPALALGEQDAASHGMTYQTKTGFVDASTAVLFYPNHGPTITSAATTSPSINEDSSGTTLIDIADGHTKDMDNDAVKGFCVSTAPTHGTLANGTTGTVPACTAAPSTWSTNVAYKPSADYCGTDTVALSAVDAFGLPGPATTFTITVTCINDTPSANAVADQSILEDSTQSVTLGNIGIGGSGYDSAATEYPISVDATSDNPTLIQPTVTPASVTGATQTTVALGLNPKTDQNGHALITVHVRDSGSNTAPNNNTRTRMFNVTVGAVNDAPVFGLTGDLEAVADAGAQHIPGWATGMAAGPATATDETGQTYAFSVTASNSSLFSVQPTVDAQTGDLDFTPTGASQCGYSTLQVTLQDNGGTANGGKDATTKSAKLLSRCRPVATADTYSTYTDTTLSVAVGGTPDGVLANDSVWSGEALKAKLVAGPTHLANAADFVFNSDGSFTYKPSGTYEGDDTFTYQAYDSHLDSLTATVTIHVLHVYYQAIADTYSMNEDGVLTESATNGVLANDNRFSGAGTLSASLVTGPTNGTLSLSPDGSFTYTPKADFPFLASGMGKDTFRYAITDGSHGTRAANATITVGALNDAPTANATSYTFYMGTTKTPLNGQNLFGADLKDLDNPFSSLKYCLVSGPSAGTLTLAPPSCASGTPGEGKFTYHAPTTPGTYSLSFESYDGQAYSAPATVSLVVTNTNNAPNAPLQNVIAYEDTPLTITLSATDKDGDNQFTYSLVPDPAGNIGYEGTVVLQPGSDKVTYTPQADICSTPGNGAPDQFQYAVDDGTGAPNSESSPGLIRVTIRCVDDAPSFTPGGDVVVARGDGAQQISPWATNISPGPPNEAKQRIRFVTTWTGNLFTPGPFDPANSGVPPYVLSPSSSFVANPGKADLFFQVPPSKQGASTVTVCLIDDGLSNAPLLYGGADATTPCSVFRILVHGAPVSSEDTYRVYRGKTLVVPAPGVLGNDVNFDGLRPTLAQYDSPPTAQDASAFSFNADGSFMVRPRMDAPAAFGFTYIAQSGYGDDGPITAVHIVVVDDQTPFAAFNASGLMATGTPTAFTDHSDDPDGFITSWVWDFGDGEVSNDPNPIHTYARAGDYKVSLTIQDDAEVTDTVSHVLHITGDPVDSHRKGTATAFGGDDVDATSGDLVTLTGSASPIGGIQAWGWNEGLGPRVELHGVHSPVLTFTAPDVPPGQTVEMAFDLTVYDGIGASTPARVLVHVHAPNAQPDIPVEDFSTLVGQTFYLDASGTKDPDHDNLTYAWSQTGGPRVGMRNLTQARASVPGAGLSSPMELTFQLLVSDGHHSLPAVKVVHVNVTTNDVADLFGWSAGKAGAGQITFHYLQPHDGDVMAWDFGDGATSTDRDPVHTYAKTGRYVVTLHVTDANGHVTAAVEAVDTRLGYGDAAGALPATSTTVLKPGVAFAGLAILVALGAGIAFLVLRRRQ